MWLNPISVDKLASRGARLAVIGLRWSRSKTATFAAYTVNPIGVRRATAFTHDNHLNCEDLYLARACACRSGVPCDLEVQPRANSRGCNPTASGPVRDRLKR
jgi:hypothetical protein